MSRKKVAVLETFPGLPERLKRVRGELSQEEFGKLLGVRKSTICRYEAGRVPDPETLDKIAVYGRVTVQWLLHGEEKCSPPMLQEETLELYTSRPVLLIIDDLVRAMFLSHQHLKARRLTFTDHQEAQLIAYIYEYLNEYHADPGEVVIRRLADLIQRQK